MTTTLVNHRCQCGGSLDVIDASGYSTTARCRVCLHCSLIIEHPRFKACIRLDDFHSQRGNRPYQRPIDDLSLATEVVQCLNDALPLTFAAICEFGVTTGPHYNALAYAVDVGVTAYDLDRVRGDGPAITQLVLIALNQPYSNLEFDTIYDGENWWDEPF